MKLGLGTVQFGLDYGITNAAGRTPESEVRSILTEAGAHGVEVLDTAALYGASEEVLGRSLPRPHGFRIISKTLALDPALPADEALKAVADGLRRSLECLGETCLGGLLVHRIDDLLGPRGDAFFTLLDRFRQDGLVAKIGASIYTPQEAFALLQRYPVGLVQLPLNPFDQRHLAAGSLTVLAEAGVEIHVRSALLQGLLLSQSAPPGLEELAPPLAAWHRLADDLGLTPLQACLAFLKGIPQVDVVLCGTTTLAEWREIIVAHASAPALPTETFKKLAVADDKLIDPRYWPQR